MYTFCVNIKTVTEVVLEIHSFENWLDWLKLGEGLIIEGGHDNEELRYNNFYLYCWDFFIIESCDLHHYAIKVTAFRIISIS